MFTASPRPDMVAGTQDVLAAIGDRGVLPAGDRGGRGELALLAVFAAWEMASPHPMLSLRLFADRRLSAAIAAVGLTMFGRFGALFLLTQCLQFKLGYTALQAGLRLLPAAGAIALAAPSPACWCEQLYLTVNTVETHLRHIYQKLGIHRRVELMTLLDGQAESVSGLEPR